MASIPENGVVISVHAHSIRQHLLLVVQERVGAEIVCEIGTLVDSAAFDRPPRPGGSIGLGAHRCRLSFDPTTREGNQKPEKQSEVKIAEALLRLNCGGGGEQRRGAVLASFGLRKRAASRPPTIYLYFVLLPRIDGFCIPSESAPHATGLYLYKAGPFQLLH